MSIAPISPADNSAIAPDFSARLNILCDVGTIAPAKLKFGEGSRNFPVFTWLTFEKYLSVLLLTVEGRRFLEHHSIDEHSMFFARYVEPVLDLMKRNGIDGPLLLKIGDNRQGFDFPTITKSVQTTARKGREFILNLNEKRHWRHIDDVKAYDIAHDMKKKELIWRGGTTGSFSKAKSESLFRPNLALRFDAFREHDIGFTEIVQIDPDTTRVPIENLRGMLRRRTSIREQLDYRYLLSLEGNDVASGLKWMLYSNSTVLMPTPTCETWACENMLRPYVHFVPVEDDLSDLNIQVAWCRDNPESAKRIAHSGKAFIKELLSHDEDKISSEVVKAASRAGIVEFDDAFRQKLVAIQSNSYSAPRTQKIVVDCTGYLSNILGKPTGIPRIEQFLAEAALCDPDPSVTCAYFHATQRCFVALPKRSISLTRPGADTPSEGRFAELLLSIDRSVRSFPISFKQFDRDAARLLVDAMVEDRLARGMSVSAFSKRTCYLALKIGVRLRRTMLNRWRHRKRVRQGILPRIEGTLLLSNKYLPEKYFFAIAAQVERFAFIFHDGIPTLAPDYLEDHAAAEPVSRRTAELRAAGALAFHSSDSVKRELESIDALSGVGAAPSRKFRIPSILHHTTQFSKSPLPEAVTRPFVLYCSTIEVRKNHLMLLKVWQRAHEKGIDLPDLVLVGRIGWGVDEFGDFLQANPAVSRKVVVLNSVADDELATIYKESQFCVFPSRYEGWGMGASEALDFGVPVISSDIPALKEATQGLMPMIDPDDLEGWFAAIVELSKNVERRKAMREKIRSRYRRVPVKGSWEEMKNAMREVASR